MGTSNYPNGITSYGAPIMPGGVPFGPKAKTFFVDPTNGNDDKNGLTLLDAKATVAAAYALTTSGRNDVVYFIGGASSSQPTATITWSNSYTHLIGLSSPVPGVGQRCRIVGTSGNDLTNVLTISGDGCIFQNIQVANFADANVDSGAVIVSGSRNGFGNFFAAGMGHVTPAARAGSYSLTLSGSENHFERSSVGLDTVVRAAANAELLVTGGERNTFWNSRVLSASETAGKFAVSITGLDRYIEFKDCIFQNFSVNWVNDLTNAFSITEASTHYVLLRGACQFVGFTGIADTVTRIYGAGPAPNAGMFLSTQPTT